MPAPRAKAQPPEREAARERPPQREQVAVSQIPADAMEESDQDSGGLLRRMSSVFQRAVRGKIPKGEEADED